VCRFKVVKRSRCLCLLRTYMRAEDEISKKLFPGLLSHGILRKSKTNKLERSTTGGRYVNRPLLQSFPVDDGKSNTTTTSSAKQQRETTTFAVSPREQKTANLSFSLVKFKGALCRPVEQYFAIWTVFSEIVTVTQMLSYFQVTFRLAKSQAFFTTSATLPWHFVNTEKSHGKSPFREVLL